MSEHVVLKDLSVDSVSRDSSPPREVSEGRPAKHNGPRSDVSFKNPFLVHLASYTWEKSFTDPTLRFEAFVALGHSRS